MSNQNLKDSGIKLPVICPACLGECEYISTGKHGNVLTHEPMIFVAFFGCKPCYAVIVATCDQVWAAFNWDEMIQAHKDDKLIHNPIDEFFGTTFGGNQDYDEWEDDDDYFDDDDDPPMLNKGALNGQYIDVQHWRRRCHVCRRPRLCYHYKLGRTTWSTVALWELQALRWVRLV